MNFASLLRMHQNRQPINNYYGNQYMINCNRKNDTPIIYGAGNNNFSGIKKRNIQPIEPMNQSLMEIYSNFQDNPHVQWILQLQSHKVKIHKFKPSKIKTKKEDTQKNQKFQPRLYQQQRQHIHPINQIMTQDNQTDFIQQDHPIRQKKNYSPMHQMRPKTFNHDQNWRENLNQNKFSFGDDSQQISQAAMQQKIHQGQQNMQQESHMENQSQMNTQNQSYIEERNQYEVQQRNFKGRGVNLMNEFQQFQNQGQLTVGNKNDREDIKPIHQLGYQKSQNINKGEMKKSEQQVQFNPNIGFSFDEIDKIGQDQQNTKNEPINSGMTPQPEDDSAKETQATDRPQGSSFNNQQNSNNTRKSMQTPIQQQTKQPPITLINTDRDNQQSEKKTSTNVNPNTTTVEQQSYNDSNLRSKQSSPHRIYCRANVRNLTPEKFKYPRVDSKIQSNSEIQPFTMQPDTTKTKTQTNINVVNAKIENVESEKLIIVSSSDRLLALIDESKRLLESRNVNDVNKNEDRIRRIVLHQQPTTETKIILKDMSETPKNNEPIKTDTLKNSQKVNDQQMQQKLTTTAIQTASKTQVTPQQQTKKLPYNLTPQKNEVNIPSVSSPRSPLQQKPKFFNQLANIQTNYTPQRTNLAPYTRYTENTGTQKQTSQFVPMVSNQTNVIKNAQVGQQNYLQTNYTYKPLNLPQQPKQLQQKDTSVYKPTGYQPNLSPYQPSTQPYQPTVQPYSQFNDLSNIQKPPIQTQLNQNPNAPQVKTYSPYFPVNNTNVVKPSSVAQVQQNKMNQVYQTYTYNGFPSTQQQNQPIRPLGTNETNNYIKINTNYVSPLEKHQKTEQKETYQIKVNGDVAQKENLRPIGLGIEGIKCVESKIYEPKTITNVQNDPKETSIQFSLRIEEHFHLGTK